MKSKKVILGSLLGVAMVGAVALTSFSPVRAEENNTTSFLGRIADILNVQEQDLGNAFKTARVEQIDRAVADGKMTEDRAAFMKEHAFEGEYGFGEHFGRKGKSEGMGAKIEMREHMNEVAELFGMSQDEIHEAKLSGKSLIDIANEKGVNIEDVKSLIRSQMEESINLAVEEGKIDEDRANEMRDKIEERVDFMVTMLPTEDHSAGIGRGMARGMGYGQNRD